MLELQHGHFGKNCSGFSRRSALKVGFLGALGISSADLIRLRAEGKTDRNNKSVILIWLDGGPSHMETYDPKPKAPKEYRGPWGDMATNVPGIRFSEMLPLQAKHADKMCVLRSVHHDNGDHFAAAHWMLTGRHGSTSKDKAQKYPSVGSCVSRAKGPNRKGMPAYVGLPAAESVYLYPGYQGAAYLGSAFNPFQLNMKQKYLAGRSTTKIQKAPVLANLEEQGGRVQGRVSLLESLDQINRDIDQSGSIEALDRYQQEAVDMVLSGRARAAFDIDRESDVLRDLYGRGPWGHYTLMARRLVEQGVSFVTVDMPHWDNHSKIKDALEDRLPYLDRAVAGLLEDLKQRGMLDDTLVVVMGEFGRTPRIGTQESTDGRDHWPVVMSACLAGGGMRHGQVIGSTEADGSDIKNRPVTPGDLAATIYHHFGVPQNTTYLDSRGRPQYVVAENGKPIRELI